MCQHSLVNYVNRLYEWHLQETGVVHKEINRLQKLTLLVQETDCGYVMFIPFPAAHRHE